MNIDESLLVGCLTSHIDESLEDMVELDSVRLPPSSTDDSNSSDDSLIGTSHKSFPRLTAMPHLLRYETTDAVQSGRISLTGSAESGSAAADGVLCPTDRTENIRQQ